MKNVFVSPSPLRQTTLFLPAITWKFSILVWFKYTPIMVACYLGNIFCITITCFNRVAIEYFMELVGPASYIGSYEITIVCPSVRLSVRHFGIFFRNESLVFSYFFIQ